MIWILCSSLFMLAVPQCFADGINSSHFELDDYRKNSTTAALFPQVENLNDILGLFEESGKCFLALDNFQSIDLLPFDYPLLISALKPLTLRWISENITISKQVTWSPKDIVLNNSILRTFNRCPQNSKFFFPIFLPYYYTDRSLHLCATIWIKWFAVNSKPWNCQVHFSLFPPPDLLHLVGSAGIFSQFRQFRYLQQTFPPSVPPVHALIKSDEMQNMDEAFLQDWMSSVTQLQFTWMNVSIYGYQILQHVFIVADTTLILNNTGHLSSLSLITKQSRVISLGVLYQARGSNKQTKLDLNPGNINIASTLRLSYPAQTDLLMWRVSTAEMKENLGKLVMFYFQKCEPPPQLNLVGDNMPSPLHRVARAYAYLWRSVMQNYTIEDEDGAICTNNKESKNSLVPDPMDESTDFSIGLNWYLYLNETLYDFPLTINDKFSRLKFVSCGQRSGTGSFDVYQFLAIFDTCVWFLIFLSGIAFSFVVTARFSRLAGNIFIFLKLLVEQGSPFSSQVLSVPRWRHVIAPFLLAGIVLSNSYKITNIYSLIAPPRPVPFENYGELLAQNFTIFSRSIFPVIFEPDEMEVVDEELRTEMVERPREILKFEHFTAVLVSEITIHLQLLRITLEMAAFAQNYSAKFLLKLERLLKSGIVNSTQLHPQVRSIVSNVLSNDEVLLRIFEAFLGILTKGMIEFERGLHEAFNTMQNGAIFESLVKCDQVSAILPEHLATAFSYRLEKLHPGKVSLGNELYSDVDIIFVLDGHVPPHIVRRLKVLRASGIWEWWMDLVVGANTTVPGGGRPEVTRNIYEKPNMTGNIVLIFLFLVSSYILTFIGLTLEIANVQGAKFIRNCYNSLVSRNLLLSLTMHITKK